MKSIYALSFSLLSLCFYEAVSGLIFLLNFYFFLTHKLLSRDDKVLVSCFFSGFYSTILGPTANFLLRNK